MEQGNKAGQVFTFFNEIAIIDQLGTTLLGKVLPDGVHPSHFAIVVHLARAGNGKTPGALASAMQVTKATMSHSLKVLERRGFIEITVNDLDARSKNVYLTDAGRAFQAEAIVAAARTFSQFLQATHIDTISELLPGLVGIRKLLDENRNPPIA
jgi:DNA-binding MarR family transcriptional regulator